MKKVIEGKIYDTKTAQEICDLPSPTQNPSDFGWHQTTLFRTAKGRFFVAGEGGPRSMWAKTVSMNSWSSGSGLRAVTHGEAHSYMEEADCTAEQFLDVGLSIEEA